MTQFSDTTNRTGIIELIERNTKTPSTSSSAYPLKVKTSDVNEALGNFLLLAIKAGGRFQVDDTNHTTIPVITTALVSDQADYSFLVDDQSPQNQIMDIRRVRVKTSGGVWKDIKQVDRETFDINQYQSSTGEPLYYDLTGNSIVLYPTPNYSASASLEMYVSRTPSYFLSTDTTKEAGIPKVFHPYLHFRPSYLYCALKGLPQRTMLKDEVDKLETMITDYYAKRNRTERGRFTTDYSGNNSNR